MWVCVRLPLQMLHDTFSAFGVIINTPKIMRDPDTGAIDTYTNALAVQAWWDRLCCLACMRC